MPFKRYRRKRPSYPIASVDNALALLELLRDFGTLRLSDAALELGISRSTAHRLLAMLVYRGFADQDAAHRYIPGPALGVAPAGMSWTAELRRRVHPHLQALSDELDETVNLMVRAGTQVRFLATVQGSRAVRVGDRQGEVMPAHSASAGKAMLAQLGLPAVKDLYLLESRINGAEFDQSWFASFEQELIAANRRGFAVNLEETEVGANALGVAIRDGAGEVVAGLSVSIPPVRFRQMFEAGVPMAVFAARGRIEAGLEDFIAGQ
ncbi:IclR family transcriptional regulator [Glutamicibacter sp. HZAU]|uniref:IclR family transcriptional regulator n=1 Tax=Glutamicibacter sp. HZAU TaxID=2049891 RepID=UPI000FFBF427|nr:IclR family transcriptional regulator [Glutamicibacter sp. HZAU]RWZ85083.1 IclR family transcriptional regulator [Glutamicibacter sp. HZAU]